MKSTLFQLAFITFLLFLFTPYDSESAQERRIALVIGNGKYISSPLENPTNDAIDMAAALEKLGFSVSLEINANQRTMESAIRTFGKKLRFGGVGLFYFAGHGIQFQGRNYLIPIGADIHSEADIKYESVDAGRVLAQMYEAENTLNIIILDACRNNPFSHSFRSSAKGLAKMDAPTGSILAYATAPGSVAADGTGRNGLYTSMLLRYIMVPDVPIEKVFKMVRIDVMDQSSKTQVPWESSSLTGDFYFNPKKYAGYKTKKPQSHYEEVSKNREIDRDDHFIAYASGVVVDTKTGLMWAAKDNGSSVTYQEAKEYCENYRGGGYTGWRLPTLDELKGLYDKNKSYQVKYLAYDINLEKLQTKVKEVSAIVHLTSLIEISSCCPWSSDINYYSSGEAYPFTYNFLNNFRLAHPPSWSISSRALPVRSSN